MSDEKQNPPAEAAPPDPLAGLVPGRIVHYHPRPSEARYAGTGNEGPWPAMVTQVGENGVCTLNVNLPVPVSIGEDPVQRFRDVLYSEAPAPGCWSWIPKS